LEIGSIGGGSTFKGLLPGWVVGEGILSRWYHRLWPATAATWMRGILPWVEHRFGRGERRPAGWWWRRLGSPNE